LLLDCLCQQGANPTMDGGKDLLKILIFEHFPIDGNRQLLVVLGTLSSPSVLELYL